MGFETVGEGFHEGPVSCADVRANGTIASGGYDGRIMLWSARGKLKRRFEAHAGLVNAVVFSPDGERLASASSDHTTRIWGENGVCLTVLRGHRDDANDVAWSPDGTLIATASFDGTAAIHDAATGERLCELRGHASDVNGVDWSPEGQLLATASDDRCVRLWTPDGACVGILEGHGDWVDDVSFSPDGSLLASASLDRTVGIWDVERRIRVHVIGGHGCTVKAVAWSPDGEMLATSAYDKQVRIFGRPDFSLRDSMENSRMWNRTLAWGAGGLMATGSFLGAPICWRPGGPEIQGWDRLGTPGINGMALSPDGTLAAFACDDGGARLVRLLDGSIVRERFDHRAALLSVAWSPDGQRVAFGGWDDRVSVYTMERSAPEHILSGCGDPVNSVAFDATGKTLAVGGFMGGLSLWSAVEGRSLGEAGRHLGSIKCVIGLSSGGFLSAGRNGVMRIDAEACPLEIEVGPTIVNGVTASADGTLLACVSRGQGVEVFERTSGRCVAVYREHPVSARTVAFSPNGKTLAAGFYDGHVLLWDLDSAPRLIRPFGATPTSTVSFSPAGDVLWIASWHPEGRFGPLDIASGTLKETFALGGSWS